MTADGRLPGEVAAWIEDVAGGRLVAARRQPGGARKEAWHVGVERADGEVADLFLRFDPSEPTPRDPWTLAREALVYLALQGTDVPVPRVLGVHPTRQAMLAERVEGENWFSRITDPDEQLATAQDFMVRLAALHRIDPASLDIPGFPPPTTIPALVAHELDEWEAVLAARGGEPDPALLFTLDWLRRNIPHNEGPVVLVQGDTGPGNFMYADGTVVAVVDWELAHFGDPMDDIAWLCLRATQEPFTHLPDRLREYERLVGYEIDDDRVRYYRVMAEAKLLVMGHRGDAPDEGGDFGGDVGNRLIYGMLHRRLWLEAMADVLGFEPVPPPPPPAADPGEHQRLYGEVLAQLREVVLPNVDDALAKQRVKGIARAVKYLEAVSRDGDYYESLEADDLAELLGRRPASVRTGRADLVEAVRAGTCSDERYFWYLQRRAARDNELLRPASGALADRHWPPLR